MKATLLLTCLKETPRARTLHTLLSVMHGVVRVGSSLNHPKLVKLVRGGSSTANLKSELVPAEDSEANNKTLEAFKGERLFQATLRSSEEAQRTSSNLVEPVLNWFYSFSNWLASYT